MEIFAKAGSADILVTLLENQGKLFLTELKRKIGKGSMSTLNTRLIELKSLGLIKDEQESKFGGRRYIWLTSKGKKIAKYLLEIDTII